MKTAVNISSLAIGATVITLGSIGIVTGVNAASVTNPLLENTSVEAISTNHLGRSTTASEQDRQRHKQKVTENMDLYVSRLAENLGIEEPELIAVMKQTRISFVEDRLEEGLISQEQADELIAEIELSEHGFFRLGGRLVGERGLQKGFETSESEVELSGVFSKNDFEPAYI